MVHAGGECGEYFWGYGGRAARVLVRTRHGGRGEGKGVSNIQ